MGRAALIGTGLVGSELLSQRNFDEVYNSKNIQDMEGSFDVVYCAGMPGVKWVANANPDADTSSLLKLWGQLKKISAQKLILISTVDVFGQPAIGNEDATPHPDCVYGSTRYNLEQWVKTRFQNHVIVRLPGLVSNLATKGPLWDLKNNHEVEKLCPASLYQWYDCRFLAKDCEEARPGINHFTTPPFSLDEMCCRYQRLRSFLPLMKGTPSFYNVYSKNGYRWRIPYAAIEAFLCG
jgi:hypothetical protein